MGARTDAGVENVRPRCCTMCQHACVRGAVRGGRPRGADRITGVRRGRAQACGRALRGARRSG